MAERCPFCKHDPFHYVDVGVGYVPAAVNCCDEGVALYSRHVTPIKRKLLQVLRLRSSHSPRRKARARRILESLYDE